ncbi:hypothetical protein EDC01DRAFT_636623 [Geopyxis carbonaria]|nr:hypothetical protein EDC01DRAFT_636623 [Geopyxis carbonaria]
MDSSEDRVDDDLFADLYGDDEPAQRDDKPKKVVAESSVSISGEERVPAPALSGAPAIPAQPAPIIHAQPAKAIDPRQPQLPIQTVQSPPQEKQIENQYVSSQGNEYNGWDASHMGQNMNENHSYDNMGGINGYGDHGSGSPAIKEDGCVFAMNFLSG